LVHLITFVLSLFLSLYLTPVFREAALKFGIVDRPSGPLKKHAEPVPYLGGLAVYLSFLLTTAFIYQYSREVLGILLAGAIIVILGLVDDLGVLSPSVKLFGQLVAATVLVKASIYIKLSILPAWVAVALTILWVMAITNAFNLIDIMDGLASGVGAIAALVLVIINYRSGKELIVPLSVALAGSLIGFLRHNFKPAKIYLGDTGSLFIGLMLAALSMNGAYTRVSLVGVLAPILILGVPVFDMLLVIYIRFRRGIPVMQGSSDHFALRLRKWRLSVVQTVVSSYFVAFLLGLVALVLIRVDAIAALAIIILVCAACLSVGYYLNKIDMTI
jgi:UDP-GlcNAc:undecaprenyl-phosphate/decaprenyl-phosphate GlcNAc-1-phosphate transferase